MKIWSFYAQMNCFYSRVNIYYIVLLVQLSKCSLFFLTFPFFLTFFSHFLDSIVFNNEMRKYSQCHTREGGGCAHISSPRVIFTLTLNNNSFLAEALDKTTVESIIQDRMLRVECGHAHCFSIKST